MSKYFGILQCFSTVLVYYVVKRNLIFSITICQTTFMTKNVRKLGNIKKISSFGVSLPQKNFGNSSQKVRKNIY